MKQKASDDWATGLDSQLLRLMDANFNRAGEAIRVVEDCLRFCLRDRQLCHFAKSLRHNLAEAGQALFPRQRTLMRDASSDPGRYHSTAAELQRNDVNAILQANLKRFQQAVRSIEEAAKCFDPETGQSVEQLRYDSYTLEKAVLNNMQARRVLGSHWLCVLIDAGNSASQFESRAKRLLDAGVPILQLRDKKLDDRRLLERAAQLRSWTRSAGAICVINDRLDIALASDADGVHLGQQDLPCQQARQLLGPKRLIGVSTHSIEQARQAVLEGADYIGAGPVFSSTTKQFSRLVGTGLLRQVAHEISLPTFAIGGIDLNNAADVFKTGIQRIALGAAFHNLQTATQSFQAFSEIRDQTRIESAEQHELP